jgi:hypothetical protein
VAATDIFTLLTADDILAGAFGNVASGSRLDTGDGFGTFLVHYGAGSSFGANNLVLTDFRSSRVAVPEPTPIFLLVPGLLVLWLRRRAGHSLQRRHV